LVVYPEIVAKNLDRAVALTGDPRRLCPHAKTHKTVDVVRMSLERGITHHKCATLAEARMLAEAGAHDVVVAYPTVGPNVARLVELVGQFPKVTMSTLVDDLSAVKALSEAASAAGVEIRVLLDIDAGMGRTGVPIGPDVLDMYRCIDSLPGLVAAGVHVYDGDVDSPSVDVRRSRSRESWGQLARLVSAVEFAGLSVPRIIVAGTNTFGIWMELALADPRMQVSPGTFVFSDWNYHCRYPEIGMTPAVIALTRVISKPGRGRITCDLGHKAVAADAAMKDRVHLLGIGPHEIARQNEEHLVIDVPDADRYRVGEVLYGVPYHICPTCALHPAMYAAREGRVAGRWQVASRDRE
jgi:D-serine deaminase-like pyridoxal phosphate-dependent protein